MIINIQINFDNSSQHIFSKNCNNYKKKGITLWCNLFISLFHIKKIWKKLEKRTLYIILEKKTLYMIFLDFGFLASICF